MYDVRDINFMGIKLRAIFKNKKKSDKRERVRMNKS